MPPVLSPRLAAIAAAPAAHLYIDGGNPLRELTF